MDANKSGDSQCSLLGSQKSTPEKPIVKDPIVVEKFKDSFVVGKYRDETSIGKPIEKFSSGKPTKTSDFIERFDQNLVVGKFSNGQSAPPVENSQARKPVNEEAVLVSGGRYSKQPIDVSDETPSKESKTAVVERYQGSLVVGRYKQAKRIDHPENPILRDSKDVSEPMAMPIRTEISTRVPTDVTIVNQLQMQLGALHRFLDSEDQLEPSDLVDKFRSIMHDNKDLCWDICIERTKESEFIPNANATLSRVNEPDSPFCSSFKADSLSAIAYALETIISKEVSKAIFDPFHPLLDESTNTNVSDLYKVVRLSEPQQLSGRWRASTFRAYDKKLKASATTQMNAIVATIEDGWRHFLGVKISETTREQLSRLVNQAYDWNCDVKSKVVSFDFQPTMDVDTSLDLEFMQPVNDHSSPNTTIFAVAPGLKSLQFMESRKDEVSWRVKVEVVVVDQ